MKKTVFLLSWLILCAVLFSVMTAAAVPGDIDGDGKLTNSDLSVIVRHLSGHGESVKLANLDVSGDGLVNNRDAILLSQALANWGVTLQSLVGQDGSDIDVGTLR